MSAQTQPEKVVIIKKEIINGEEKNTTTVLTGEDAQMYLGEGAENANRTWGMRNTTDLIEVTVTSQPSPGEEEVIKADNPRILDHIKPDDIQTVDIVRDKNDQRMIHVLLKPGVSIPTMTNITDTERTEKSITIGDTRVVSYDVDIDMDDIEEDRTITVTVSGQEGQDMDIDIEGAEHEDLIVEVQEEGTHKVVIVTTDQENSNHDTPKSDKAYLGVMISERDQGVHIDEIKPQTPAEKMGLAFNDQIVKIGKYAISNLGELSEAMMAHKVGDNVKITVLRNGKKLKFKGELDAMPVPVRMVSCGPASRKNSEELKKVIIIEKEGVQEVEAPVITGDMQISDLSLFPNPANEYIRVTFTAEPTDEITVAVVDADGRTITEERQAPFKGQFDRSLDLRDAVDRTAFVVITNGGQKLVRPIVISNR